MNKSLFAMAALGLAILSTAALADASMNTKKVVRDSAGTTILSIEGKTCVRTTWDGGNDECSAAPRAVTTRTTKTILSDDERSVYFDFNSHALTPTSQKVLEGVVRRLRNADDVKSAQIVGYADRIGSSAYNEKLSHKRAETVKNYLTKNGYLNVDVAQMRALGESRPSTSCDTKSPRGEQIACLSPDRRVDIELVYQNTTTVEETTMAPAGK